jgi:hypothetical protein
MPERLPLPLLRQAKTQRVVSVAEGLDETLPPPARRRGSAPSP